MARTWVNKKISQEAIAQRSKNEEAKNARNPSTIINQVKEKAQWKIQGRVSDDEPGVQLRSSSAIRFKASQLGLRSSVFVGFGPCSSLGLRLPSNGLHVFTRISALDLGRELGWTLRKLRSTSLSPSLFRMKIPVQEISSVLCLLWRRSQCTSPHVPLHRCVIRNLIEPKKKEH